MAQTWDLESWYEYIWYSLQDLEFSRNASTFSTNLKNTTIIIIRINNNMFQIVTIVKQIWNCLQTIVQSKWLSAISKEKQNQVLNKNMAIFSSFLVHKKNEIDKEIILTIFSLHLSLYISIEISTFLQQKSKSCMKYQMYSCQNSKSQVWAKNLKN